MVEVKPSSTPEFLIGSEVPIHEHSNLLGTLCPGRIGKVTKLDDHNQPLEAICICRKKPSINWQEIQANRKTR